MVGLPHPEDAPRQSSLRVLLVEDSAVFAAHTEVSLSKAGGPGFSTVARATIQEAAEEVRAGGLDCVLLDLGLPDADGLDGLARLQQIDPKLPVVVLSGEESEALAVEAVEKGAQDFLLKAGVTGGVMVRSIRYAVKRKLHESALAAQAFSDALTGLPTRQVFIDRLETALAREERAGNLVSVMFLDLDLFKSVNDTLGHEAGDVMLRAVARRLLESVRPSDAVARCGGDEFLILCDGIQREQQAIGVADRIADALAEPVSIGGQDVGIGASIGITFGRDRSSSADQLIHDADGAMYRAKRSGQRHAVASSAVPGWVRSVAEAELELALENGELYLDYQPELDIATRCITSVKARVRWEDPVRGTLTPSEFMPVQSRGLPASVGRWMLRTACRQLALWNTRQLCSSELTVAVDVSPGELTEPEFSAALSSLVGDTGLMPEVVRLEITELSAEDAPGEIPRALRVLQEGGFGLCLDDVGAKLLALSAIDQYPLSIWKIDGTLTAGLAGSPRAQRMYQAQVDVAHAAGLRTVAQGVESDELLRDVAALGVAAAQGSYIGGPTSPKGIELALGSQLRSRSSCLAPTH